MKDFIILHKLSFISVLETRVSEPSAKSISKFICPKFTWLFNYDHHKNGHIWIGFDPSIWNISVLDSSAQHINCSIHNLCSSMNIFKSVIYAFNGASARRPLWSDLCNFS